MNAYVYAAALLCESCAQVVKARLTAEGKAPCDPRDESSFDSDQFPKGPYARGGGEADCPQHCDSCNLFLENPLTTDGVQCVRETLACRAERSPVTQAWAEFYSWALVDAEERESLVA